MIIEISLEMNNFSHQENPVNSNASTDSFIRRRRGAVRKQNVHEVKIHELFLGDISLTIIVGDAESGDIKLLKLTERCQ